MMNMVTDALNLVELMWTFCLRSLWFVITTWAHLVLAAILFPFNVIWSALISAIAFVSFPLWGLYNAFQREKLLEKHLYEMQIEIENLTWDKNEAEEREERIIKEGRMMDHMLLELEEEHNKAIIKIELLESEDLKKENSRLSEAFEGKEFRSMKGHKDMGDVLIALDAAEDDFPLKISSWESGKGGNNSLLIEELVMRSAGWEDASKGKSEPPRTVSTGNIYVGDEVLIKQHRRVALTRSFFSLVLSLSVGIVISEAKDPCVPLVMALLLVAVLSLKSVIQLFSAINNKPASDAVLILSMNWFLIGILSWGSLPRIAQIVCPFACRLVKGELGWTLLFSSEMTRLLLLS